MKVGLRGWLLPSPLLMTGTKPVSHKWSRDQKAAYKCAHQNPALVPLGRGGVAWRSSLAGLRSKCIAG
jgi:hypothetical protein